MEDVAEPPIIDAEASAATSGIAAAIGGTRRPLSGNAPLRLDDPEGVWVVQGGDVDVFLAELEDDRASGPRHFLFTAHPGDLLFGVADPDGLGDVALQASGLAGTELVSVSLMDLRTLAISPKGAGLVAKAVEGWASAVTAALIRPIAPHPPLDATVAPDAATDCRASLRLAPQQRLGASRSPVWISVSGSDPLYLDLEDVPDAGAGALLPLCPGGWMSSAAPMDVRAVDTVAALAHEGAWQGLAILNRFLLTLLPINLRLAAVDEINRQRDRAKANHSAERQAFGRLIQVLTPSPEGEPAAEDVDDPVFAAFAAVVRAMGLEPQAPPRRVARPGDPRAQAPSLDLLLRVNRLRSRHLALQDDWWRTDVPPFLLIDPSDGRPLAVIPGRGGRYRLFDPTRERWEDLDAKRAAALTGPALMIYAPLPLEALDGRRIAGIVLGSARWDAIALVVLGVAVGLLGLGTPVAIGYLVDNAIPAHDRGGVLVMAVILLTLAGLTLLARLAVQVAALRIEGRGGTRLQAGVMDRLLRLPASFFKDFSAGDLMVRTLAIQRIQKVVTASTIGAVLNGVLGVWALGLMMWYDVRLAAVSLGLIVLFACFALVVGWLRIRYENDVMTLTSEVSSVTLQMAVGVTKIRLAGAEERAFNLWSRHYARLADRRYALDRLDALFATVGNAFTLFATTVIFAAIWAWRPGEGDAPAETALALGTVLAFLSAFSTAFTNVHGLVQTGIDLAALAPVFRHAAPILKTTPEADTTKTDPGVLAGNVELSHVTFRYAEGLTPVFADFSLSVRPGEFVAVVGPSGCGKSTLVRLLLGFEAPETGAVLYDGNDLRGLDVPSVRRQIGVVTQNSRLMAGTLLENILGANQHLEEADAWRAAEVAGLAADIRAMPMGMHTVVTDGGAFSGGQAQRIQIARAVVGQPRLLILDEATSALDNRTQAVVTESLDRLAVTRIVIAHRLSTVVNADRIVVLQGGRIAESGRYEDLVAAGGPFARFARRQMT